jgi:MoaA/NifB/PqqE/SkfB family radical SAM enzyme
VNTIRPRQIRLEVSSVCQLRCPVCPNAQGRIQKSVVGAGFLKFDDFKRLVDENTQVVGIELSNWGEALLNPQLPQILRYAYQKKIRVYLSNGVNLNHASEEVLESLVKYNVQNIRVSIDGASQEVYQKYRIGGDFEKVIQNIQKINEYKQKYKVERPHLSWQFVIFGHNEHEIKAAKKLARELEMIFEPKLNFAREYSPIENKDQVVIDAGVSVTSREEYWQKFGKHYIPKCIQLWVEPQINWDGKILGCCQNYWADFGGNAFEESLVTCLNGEKIVYARNMLLGKFSSREDIPCASCSEYLLMAREGKWLEMSEVMKLYWVSQLKASPSIFRLGRLIKVIFHVSFQ